MCRIWCFRQIIMEMCCSCEKIYCLTLCRIKNMERDGQPMNTVLNYEKSSVDDFLNIDFYDSLSEYTKEKIKESEIEVTDKECHHSMRYTTHIISREVFFLSSVELGIKGFDGNITTKEGEPLKYFTKKEFAEKGAYLEDGRKMSYWTRTPDLWDTYIVVVMGAESIDTVTADSSSGVRPAFCMDKETVIKKSGDVITGEQVYVIE